MDLQRIRNERILITMGWFFLSLLLLLVKLIHFESLNINKDLLEKLLRVCKYHKYENKQYVIVCLFGTIFISRKPSQSRKRNLIYQVSADSKLWSHSHACSARCTLFSEIISVSFVIFKVTFLLSLRDHRSPIINMYIIHIDLSIFTKSLPLMQTFDHVEVFFGNPLKFSLSHTFI